MCNWFRQEEGAWAKPCMLCVLAKLVLETRKPFTALSGKNILKVTLWHHCHILPRKEASLPNFQTLKPIIGINKLETGPGPFSPTAAFTEIVNTFLYSRCHFHFYFSVEEGSCPLLFHVQPALDILQLHILPNTKLLKQSAFGVVWVMLLVLLPKLLQSCHGQHGGHRYIWKALCVSALLAKWIFSCLLPPIL